MPSNLNTDSPKEVARQRFALAVETLSNIHYLIEQDRDDPDSVKKFVEMAEPAMGVLRDLVRDDGMRLRSSTEGSPEHPQNGQAADYTDPLPLAAAGEGKPTSGAEAPPETRVDRLEAD